jgi:WD40 repeat protein
LKNEAARSFALVSADGRLRVWDVLSNKLRNTFTEPNHLVSSFTCIDYVTVSKKSTGSTGNNNSGKPNKSQKLSNDEELIALGTESGIVIIWNTQKGEIQHRLGDDKGGAHTSRVNDVVFDASGTIVYSCGNDKQIKEWSVETGLLVKSWKGAKQAVTKLALSPDNTQLLAASTSIKLFDISNKTCIRKYNGHASAIKSLSFSSDGKFFCSAAHLDRYVCVWALMPDASTTTSALLAEGKGEDDEDGAVPKTKTAFATFAVDSPPILLRFNSSVISVNGGSQSTTQLLSPNANAKKGKSSAETKTASVSSSSKYQLACIAESSTTSIHEFTYNPLQPATANGAQPIDQPIMIIDVPFDESGHGKPKIASQFQTSKTKQKRIDTETTPNVQKDGAIIDVAFSAGNQLTLARNGGIQVQFENVSVISSSTNTNQPVRQTLALLSKSVLLKNKEEVKLNEDAAAESTYAGDTKKRKAQYNASMNADVLVGAALTGSLSRPVASLDDQATASNLENALQLSQDSQTVHSKRLKLLESSTSMARSLAARIAEASQNQQKLRNTPLAGSLQTVLSQALHTNDDALLEHCLASSSAAAKKTIARLSPQHVVPLLTRIIPKLQQAPNRGLQLVPWISECLRTHTAFLLTVPELSSQLSGLYGMIDQRLASFKKLLSLQGRLDLILSQVNRRVEYTAENDLNANSNAGPVNVFNEELAGDSNNDANNERSEDSDIDDDDDDNDEQEEDHDDVDENDEDEDEDEDED